MVNSIDGDNGSNILIGLAGENDFFPGLGNDTITGGTDFDTIVYRGLEIRITATFTAEGAGTVRGSDGKVDQFTGVEQIVGAGGADVFINEGTSFVRFRGMDGVDSYTGSASGIDDVDFRQDPAGITVNLQSGTAVDGWGNAESLTLFDSVRGSLFVDNITGSDGANSLRGLDGNDTIRGLGGNDVIDGGDGLDYAIFGGTAAAASISRPEAGRINVSSGEGDDTLYNVERLVFSDSAIAFDVGEGEIAGSVYRTYQAAFDRTPDIDGLSFWIDKADNGTSLTEIAAGFLASNEFAAAYGANPAPADYVAKLYENVLGRPGEQAGIDFWTGKLTSGEASNADVLASFSQSSENVALVAPQIANGFAYIEMG